MDEKAPTYPVHRSPVVYVNHNGALTNLFVRMDGKKVPVHSSGGNLEGKKITRSEVRRLEYRDKKAEDDNKKQS